MGMRCFCTMSRSRWREKLRERLKAGKLDERLVEIDVKERGPTFEISTNSGMEEMDVNLKDLLPVRRRGCLRCGGYGLPLSEVRCDMSLPNTARREIRPTHPGEMLREDFLPDYGLTVASLAEAVGVSRQSMNELLRERRAVSPEMALRLSRLFSNPPEFWLNAQRAVDLWDAAKTLKAQVARIKPLKVA